jgi:phenylpropionate dioxygenase-like ring-hydroxylating dioxygenase large terminal subunit
MEWTNFPASFAGPDRAILARFWHPVAYSSEVGGRPFASRLLDENLVIYRTRFGVTAARDICLHRGVRLSRGEMLADEIVCPYHGFRYDATGACTLIPAQAPHLPISSKLTLRVYPAVERYGLIWVRLDPDHEAGPLPEWPEFADPQWEIIQMPADTWNAAATRHAENFSDVAHLSFVHTGTFGNPLAVRVAPYEVSAQGSVLHFQISYEQLDVESLSVDRPKAVPMRYDYHLSLLFSSRLRLRHPEGRDSVLYDIAAPITARSSRIYFFILRNHDHKVNPQEYIDFQKRVLDEDRPMVEDQRPEELPLDLHEEVHLQCDKFSVAYRKALKSLGLGQPFSS